MEYIKRDMSLEIRTRKLTSPQFHESDFWNFLGQAISALAYL